MGFSISPTWLLSGTQLPRTLQNAFATTGDINVLNSTIADNNPQGDQAVIVFSGGQITVTNSIMWSNAFNLQTQDDPCPGCVTVTYSDIEGGYTGAGNIDADPLFVGNGNYQLQSGSPCIDTGANLGAPAYDINQVVRPQDGDGDGEAIVDMGAFEFFLYRIFIPLIMR